MHNRQALVLVVICSLWYAVAGYNHGGFVPALKRTQYKGFRTEWAELPSAEAPRFGFDRTVMIYAIDPSQEVNTENDLKISFSFDHDRFLTSWITVADGRGTFLSQVEFVFVYSGDHVRQVKWFTSYHGDENNSVRPDQITLKYHWQEYVETDAKFGLNFLLFVGSLVAWVAGVLALFDRDGTRKSANKQN